MHVEGIIGYHHRLHPQQGLFCRKKGEVAVEKLAIFRAETIKRMLPLDSELVDPKLQTASTIYWREAYPNLKP